MCQKETIRFLFFLVLYVIYLVIGALVFEFIEKPVEEKFRETLDGSVSKFIVDHQHCLSEEELVILLKQVVNAKIHGVSVTRLNESTTNWSFGQSVFFAASVVTTIGYGNVTPLSEAGKLFCIGYGFIGVIVTAVLFNAIILRLLRPTWSILRWIQARLCSCRSLSPLQHRLIGLSVLFLFTVSLVFLLPSIVFEYLEEDWNFFHAFYFCFVSLLTIGLGDYIPADGPQVKHRNAYKIGAIVYIYFGLILVLLFTKCVYHVPELKLHDYFVSQRPSVSEEDEDERSDETAASDDEESQMILPVKTETIPSQTYSSVVKPT